ncbi:ABC transporter permease [uncultured Bacteroides sp.]|uniref:ABC transporter permease n=1 Tax=uncultured Bacteroides sp. TaxID=162156 RepID=UPI00262373CB|nr:ABC transporter permease [uncultured Bacteroides sp.]
MILHYFKIAFRNLCKYKTQNIISIIGLAVGLLCFCICIYCSRFVESTDHCFANHNRIAELNLYDSKADRYFSGSPVPLAEELRTWSLGETEAISSVTYPRERPYYVELSQEKILPYELETIEIDTFYNEIFTPEMVAGHWKMASQSLNSVILSQYMAIKIFGNAESAIGKHMTLMRRLNTSPESTPKTGGIVYTIQAVMKDIPLNNSLDFMQNIDMLTVNDSEGLLQSPKRHNMTGASTYALLAAQTTCAALEKQFSKRNYTYTLYNESYTITANGMGTQLKKQGASYLALVTGIIGTLILLVGLINFFHFLIGSFFNRTKEYSIMKMAGCNWKQLFSLLFIQSLIVISISFVLVLWGIELLGDRMNFSLSGLVMSFSPELLLMHTLQYIVFLIILCAIICLFVSARIRRISVQTGIYGNNKRRGKQWGRNFMLGIQFFICWVFVSLTVALYLQSEKTANTLFHTLSQREKAEILSIPLDYPFMKNEEKLTMIERFKQHAGVKEVLLSDISYMHGMSGNGLTTEKGNENSWIDISIMAVPSNFFSFMNISIEQGSTPQTEKEIIVDRAWQEIQKKEVIGMNLYSWKADYTICGISAPFQADVYNRSSGYAFVPYDSSIYIGHCYIKSHPGQQKDVAQWIEKVCREMLPENITYQTKTFLDDIHEEQAIEYNLKDIILFFAIVSIIITLLGVYSSITLDTERRQKEVAIRKVNGADVPQIILLFARLYIILLFCSAVIAFPLVYAALMLWKQMYTVFFDCGFLFWLCIFLIVTFITAITILFRILRIARSNPAEVIKNE